MKCFVLDKVVSKEVKKFLWALLAERQSNQGVSASVIWESLEIVCSTNVHGVRSNSSRQKCYASSFPCICTVVN